MQTPGSQVPPWMHSVISHEALMEQRALLREDKERDAGTAPTSLFACVHACLRYFYFQCSSSRNVLRAVLTTKGAF